MVFHDKAAEMTAGGGGGGEGGWGGGQGYITVAGKRILESDVQ